MDFKTEFPEYACVEEHIRRAHAERAVAVASLIAHAIDATVRGFKQLRAGLAYGVRLERDIHAMQVDALFRKSLPHH